MIKNAVVSLHCNNNTLKFKTLENVNFESRSKLAYVTTKDKYKILKNPKLSIQKYFTMDGSAMQY